VSRRRPYIYQDREWAEIAGIEEKVDVQGDEVPLSEFDQPYLFGNDEDDTYPSYETDYPDFPRYPFPDPDPVPIPGPCNAEDGCGFVNFVDFPDEIECEDEYWFRTVHSVHGCEPASFEDAFLVWWIAEGPGELIGGGAGDPPVGGVGVKYIAPENNDGATVVLCVSSIDGSCSICRDFKIKCAACCEEFEIIGADTANPSSIWSGAITPPCPGAECTVTNNSGCPMECSVNPDGTTVTVGVGAKNCGSFTVTVTEDTSTPQKQEDNCPGESASKSVRINGNGGFWKTCWFSSAIFCNGPFCSCSWTEGERRWGVGVGAGIFCGPDAVTRSCFDNWNPGGPGHPGNILFSIRIDVRACDNNGPCAGSRRWGESIAYWVNPDCECI